MPQGWDFIFEGPGGVKIKVDPARLPDLEQKFRRQLAGRFEKLGLYMIAELTHAYATAIRTRPRREGQPLHERLQKALTFKVYMPINQVWMGVFDLARMDRETQGEGFHTDYEGWFLKFEDGHDGYAHGSREWKFIPMDWALELADDAARALKLSEDKAAELKAYVRDKFQGRHGEGIMVHLDTPLFFEYPEFGRGEDGESRARNIVGDYGHPGYQAWDILRKTAQNVFGDRPNNGARKWINDAVDESMAAAVREL